MAISVADLMEIIKKRKSIRAYKEKPLPKDVISAILEAGKHAPTARNLQQLEYKVITNKALITRLSDGIKNVLTREASTMKTPPVIRPNFFHNAPLLIIITGPRGNPWSMADAALAAQNIMLYATSIGLGSCYIGMARNLEKDDNLLQELHISKDRIIAASVICGYSAEQPEPKEKKLKAEYFE
jgi:nitroreductase